MRPFGIAVLVATLGVFVPRTVLSADWYVDAAGAAGGDGSMAKPFTTINGALGGLQRGDTVWIASGTYAETVNFWMLPGSSGRTTVRAMPGATPVIDGASGSASAGFVLQAGTPDMTFQGLTIQNSSADGIEVYQADGGQVIDCTTTGISGNAVTFYYANDGLVSGSKLQGGVGGRRSTGTVVEDSELYGCTNHEGITIYDDSTNCQYLHNVIHDNFSVNLYLDSISHSVIDGNLIYESTPGNNDVVGLELSDETYSDLPAPVNSHNTIVNNVIIGNEWGIQFWKGDFASGSGLIDDVISNNTLVNNLGAIKWDAGAHSGTTIENNIVVVASSMAATYLLQANSTSGITLDHNLWYAPGLDQAFLWGSGAGAADHAAWIAASGQGMGDVLSNPSFAGAWTAPPATNLELAMGSPAIDVGVAIAAVTDDFLGAPRPHGSGYDLGAFEYGSTPADGGMSVGPAGGGDASAAPGPTGDDASADRGSDASSGSVDSGTARPSNADGGPMRASPSSSSSGCACSAVRRSPADEGPTALWLAAATLGLVGARARGVRERADRPRESDDWSALSPGLIAVSEWGPTRTRVRALTGSCSSDIWSTARFDQISRSRPPPYPHRLPERTGSAGRRAEGSSLDTRKISASVRRRGGGVRTCGNGRT